jgi:hypothetical protein
LRVRRRGDALDGDTAGAGRWLGVAGEHQWGLGVAPGKRRGGTGQSGGVSAEAVAGVREERASVVVDARGGVL